MSEWRPRAALWIEGMDTLSLLFICLLPGTQYTTVTQHAYLELSQMGKALPPCLSCWGLFIIPTPFPRTLRGTGMTASRLIVVGARGKARNKNQSAPLIPVIPSSLIRGKQDLLKQSCASRAASGLRKGGVMSDHPLWRRSQKQMERGDTECRARRSFC